MMQAASRGSLAVARERLDELTVGEDVEALVRRVPTVGVVFDRD